MSRKPPEDWVRRFKTILSRNGVSIDDTFYVGSKGNVFLARWKEQSKCIVAAGSTRIGFWGIQKSVVATMRDKACEWGALFLDMRASGKGYWVDDRNVLKVSDSTNALEYLFHAPVLDENWELVLKIDGKDEAEIVCNFLSVAGLEVDK